MQNVADPAGLIRFAVRRTAPGPTLRGVTTYVCPLLVGRDAERAAVEAALANRGTVVVVGPAGVGKSALVRHATEDRPVVIVRATPSSVLRAAAYERICDLRRAAAASRRRPPTPRTLLRVRRSGAKALRWLWEGQLALVPPTVDAAGTGSSCG